MPVTVLISNHEAEALRAVGVDDIQGNRLTYNPSDTLTILNAMPVGEARNRLSERMAQIASQIGRPDVMFEQQPAKKTKTKVKDEPAIEEMEPETPAYHHDESIDISQSESGAAEIHAN